MRPLRARAPGKVNLCLFLGPTRPDGRHELVSLIESLSLADELVLERAGPRALADEVLCPGVAGPNLAAAALRRYRAASGWSAPPVRLSIAKQVPVAAGMGGGSGDAAAALRLAAHAAGRPGDLVVDEVAPGLGADVPSQLRPGLCLVSGAGERVDPRPALHEHVVLVLPSSASLSTAAVYAEADRLGLGRPRREIADLRERVELAMAVHRELPDDLVVNDLEPAARSLLRAIDAALADARAAGAHHALVSGSGPTVVGIFTGPDAHAAGQQALGELRPRYPGAVLARPVGEAFGAVEAAGGVRHTGAGA